MKKIITLLIGTLMLLFISYSVTKESKKVFMPLDSRTILFGKGSNMEIRQYLDSDGAYMTHDDYYLLIANNRLIILEILFRDYKLDPNYGAKDKIDPPLMVAVDELNIEAAEIIIKYGGDVNYVDRYNNTALILAAKSAFAIPENKEKSRQMSKLLIDAGANVNAVGKWFTPLDSAIYSKDMINVKYMVDRGADINYIDSDGSNYLFSCSEFECILYFLDKGLDINTVNNKNQSFIVSVVSSKLISTRELEKLIELGADICHTDNDGLNILKHLEISGINPHRKKENPDFYYKKIEEHKNTELYKYLEKEYKNRCE